MKNKKIAEYFIALLIIGIITGIWMHEITGLVGIAVGFLGAFAIINEAV